MRDRSFVVNVRFDRLKLPIIRSKQLVTPIRVPGCNPDRKPAVAEMPNDSTAKKPGSAEYDNGALVRGRHGSNSPAYVADVSTVQFSGVDGLPTDYRL
jgi:hypothetical protein